MISLAWPSNHFSQEETTHSSAAIRHGIDNTPKDIITQRNIVKAAHFMDDVRDILGTPVHVDSWYRCPELNKLVGGVSTSAHCQGWAIDFTSPRFGDPSRIFQYLLTKKNSLLFDQLILEFNSWVHISFAPTLRGDCLIFNGKSYRRV